MRVEVDEGKGEASVALSSVVYVAVDEVLLTQYPTFSTTEVSSNKETDRLLCEHK